MSVQNLGTIGYVYVLRIAFEVCMGFYMGKHTFLHFPHNKLEFFQNRVTDNVKT